MKPDYAEAILEQDWIKCGPFLWVKDIPSGRLFIKYVWAADRWRAGYRGLSDDSHLIANFDHDPIGALKWAEQVEEAVSHEGD